MKTKFLIISTLLILSVCCSIVSCSEDKLDQIDPNVIVQDVFFQNSTELESAINAIYSFQQSQGMYGRIAFYLYDNLSQENTATDVLQGPLREFLEYGFNAANPDLITFWRAAYRGISSANFVIDANENNLINTSSISQNEIVYRVGEAHFMRALYYFQLTTLWGGVPVLTALAEDADGTPKSTQEEVYNLILADLEIAKANLANSNSNENGRANSGSAGALKGKVHLFLKQYAEAKAEFDAIAGMYTIAGVPHINSANLAGEFSPESIFEIGYSREIGGDQWNATGNGLAEVTFRALEYSSLGFGNIQVNPKLFSEFEDDDPRIQSTFYVNGDAYGPERFDPDAEPPFEGAEFGEPDEDGMVRLVRTISAPEWRKYQNLDDLAREDFQFSGINFRVIRYADVLLMLAEAENELGNIGVAISLLNQIRDRVDMPNYGTAEMNRRGYPVGSQQQVFDAIVHERAVELAGEQVRYLDLQRWGLASQVLDGYQTGKHELLPIPQQEIDSNPQLTDLDQNTGY